MEKSLKIAIIPARGGSKRIKKKNIINFCGKPLIQYSIELAKKAKLFDKIHVSTEDTEIIHIVESLGIEVDFLRDQSLADDHTGVLPVLKWVIEKYKENGLIFNDVCLLMPTAPLLVSEDLINAYAEFIKHGRKFPTMACSRFPAPVEWAHEIKEGLLVPRDSSATEIRSQDLNPCYYDTGSFSFLSRKHLEDGFPHQFLPQTLPRERAVDIDDMEDLKLAEILYKGLLK